MTGMGEVRHDDVNHYVCYQIERYITSTHEMHHLLIKKAHLQGKVRKKIRTKGCELVYIEKSNATGKWR